MSKQDWKKELKEFSKEINLKKGDPIIMQSESRMLEWISTHKQLWEQEERRRIVNEVSEIVSSSKSGPGYAEHTLTKLVMYLANEYESLSKLATPEGKEE